MSNFVGRCLGHESKTIAATAAGLDSIPAATAVKENAFLVAILTTTERIRCRFDGTAPTSSVGYLMHGEDSFAEYIIEGRENLANLQMIREGADSAVINVAYFEDAYRREQV